MSSDDDRFEALVREALHEEEPSLPVRITAAELRARAGARRGRWSLLMSTRSWLGALVPIAVLVAVVAAFTIGPLGSSPVGGTPAPSAAVPTVALASAPSSAPTSTATALPTPTPPSIDLGVAGDVVFVQVAEDGTIHVRSIGANGERTLYETQAALPFAPTGKVSAISTDGHLAIEVDVAAASGGRPEGTWLIDMRDPRDPGQLVPGAAPAFGPTGDLITFTRDRSLGTSTIHRYRFRPDGDIDSQSEIPVPVVLDVLPVFAEDGSGLFASGRIRPPALGILEWDGTVVDRRVSWAPWFATGTERPSGVNGDSLVASSWRSADGTMTRVRLPDGVSVDDSSWTRDGDTVVFVSLARGRAALYAIDAADRTHVRRLGTLPGPKARITGMTDDAAIVTLANGESVEVALDGSGTIGDPHPGVPALIVP
jgi:hypothetical protein